MIIDEEVPPSLAGQRLDRLVALLAEVSRSIAVVLIDGGFVRVDGEVSTHGKGKLSEGQRLAIDLTGVPSRVLPQPDPSVVFEIVHADDDLVVIDKPAGLVVHPAVGNDTGTLVNGLLARFPEIAGVGEPQRPGIVHRLDAGTSGLLIVARTPVAHAVLSRALASHSVERTYTALVWGHPSASNGLIDAPIGRHPNDPLRMAVVVNGKAARTHFSVDRRFEEPVTALLTCQLETGRTHQIRVHLAAIDHPVVGDPVYSGRRPQTLVARPFLHARRLSFAHPVTGEPLEFESALPADRMPPVYGRHAGPVVAMPASSTAAMPAQ